MERIFEFLFKYPPLFFEQGDFTFGAPMSVRLWLIIAGTLGAATVASYTIARGKSTVTDRGIMAGLRVLLLAVIIVCLLQPSLILSTVVPQQNFVGILIDDSQSMLLADENGEPRNSFINEELLPMKVNSSGNSPIVSRFASFVSLMWPAESIVRRN